MSYEKLMKVLETDSEEGIIELAVERIKELEAEDAEKKKRVDELDKQIAKRKEMIALMEEQKELKQELAKRKADIAKLNKEQEALQEKLQSTQMHVPKLFQVDSPDSEIGKLKLARANIYRREKGLPDDNHPRFLNNHQRVMNDSTHSMHRPRLINDGLDPVIDELKRQRMQLYEERNVIRLGKKL